MYKYDPEKIIKENGLPNNFLTRAIVSGMYYAILALLMAIIIPIIWSGWKTQAELILIVDNLRQKLNEKS